MRELWWSLRKQWWSFLAFVVVAVIGVGMVYTVMAETGGYSLFELCYRTMFVLLQLMFVLLQRERFQIVLRKVRAHRFYRSMPYAWEKEQRRFVWLDVFCVAMLAVLLAVGIICRNRFDDTLVPYAMVVYFLIYVPTSRIVACVPYVWWMTEILSDDSGNRRNGSGQCTYGCKGAGYGGVRRGLGRDIRGRRKDGFGCRVDGFDETVHCKE